MRQKYFVSLVSLVILLCSCQNNGVPFVGRERPANFPVANWRPSNAIEDLCYDPKALVETFTLERPSSGGTITIRQNMNITTPDYTAYVDKSRSQVYSPNMKFTSIKWYEGPLKFGTPGHSVIVVSRNFPEKLSAKYDTLFITGTYLRGVRNDSANLSSNQNLVADDLQPSQYPNPNPNPNPNPEPYPKYIIDCGFYDFY